MTDSIDIKKELKVKTKIKRIVIPILFGIFIFILIFSLAFGGYVYAYQNKVYPGVKMANYNIDGFEKSEVKEKIAKKVDKLNSTGVNFSTKDPNNQTKEISYEDLGITFDQEVTLDQIFAVGRTGNTYNQAKEMLGSLFKSKDIDLVTNIDQNKFDSKLNDSVGNQIIEAKDAKFKVDDDNLEIIKEENGVEINYDYMKLEIEDLINSENIYKSLTIKTKEVQPSIVSAEIIPLINDVESYINKDIILSWEKNTFNSTQGQILDWLVLSKDENDSIKIELSDEAIKSYINEEIAAKVDKKAINRQINAETSEVIFEGQDGQIVNQDKALVQIKNILTSDKQESKIVLEILVKEREDVKVQPKTEFSSGGTPGMSDGKYIEVNLSQQKLYMFEGENQLGTYSVSTGKWSTPTPTGTRYVDGKTDRAWSNKYGLYMPYWMSIGGGYGIHELPEWPGGAKEGESHLGTPVSHGCIRLGVGAAENVYSWASIGTPVFIHQ